MVNFLEDPAPDASFEDQMRHHLAWFIAQGFPVHPKAERSTHPVWKDWGRITQMQNNPEVDCSVVAVFSATDAEWVEFLNTYSDNSDHYGIVGEVETADGWKGRYCYEAPLGEIIRSLLMED